MLMSSLCNSSGMDFTKINSDNFCKLATKECTNRNAPHIFPCGPSMCARNETECKQFMIVEKKIKLEAFINVLKGRENFMNAKFKESFVRFKFNIKNCTLNRYKWQQEDVCVRKRDCFQKKFNFFGPGMPEKSRVNCPCSKSKAYVCESQKMHCSVNKEACNSFSYLANKNRNSTDRARLLLSIKICD